MSYFEYFILIIIIFESLFWKCIPKMACWNKYSIFV